MSRRANVGATGECHPHYRLYMLTIVCQPFSAVGVLAIFAGSFLAVDLVWIDYAAPSPLVSCNQYWENGGRGVAHARRLPPGDGTTRYNGGPAWPAQA